LTQPASEEDEDEETAGEFFLAWAWLSVWIHRTRPVLSRAEDEYAREYEERSAPSVIPASPASALSLCDGPYDPFVWPQTNITYFNTSFATPPSPAVHSKGRRAVQRPPPGFEEKPSGLRQLVNKVYETDKAAACRIIDVFLRLGVTCGGMSVHLLRLTL
jgi:hypothetical protein